MKNSNLVQVSNLARRQTRKEFIQQQNLSLEKKNLYLLKALHDNRSEELELILECGADPNARFSNGFSVLHYAVLAGHIKLVRILLNKGASTNALDNLSRSPAHLACIPQTFYQGSPADMLEILELLHHFEANLHHLDKLQRSPLHHAVTNSLIMTQYLIAQGLNPCHPSIEGITPIHVAAALSDAETLSYLLTQNVPLDIETHPNPLGTGLQTPLFFAIQTLNLTNQQVLLSCKKNPINHPNQSGNTALHATIIYHYNKPDKLINALTLLIKHNIDCNLQNKEGMTALNLAIQTQCPLPVIQLLANHTNLNTHQKWIDRPAFGSTLHQIIQSPYPLNDKLAIIDTLLQQGAEVDVGDAKLQTPLDLANNLPESDKYLVAEKLIQATASNHILSLSLDTLQAFQRILEDHSQHQAFHTSNLLLQFQYQLENNQYNPLLASELLNLEDWIDVSNEVCSPP